MITQEQLNNWQKEAYKTADDNGFNSVKSSETLMNLLVNSENFEALDDLRKGHGIAETWRTDNGWFIMDDVEPNKNQLVVFYDGREGKPCDPFTFSSRMTDYHPDYTHWKPFKAPTGRRKPCGFLSELSDVCIRIFHLTEFQMITLDAQYVNVHLDDHQNHFKCETVDEFLSTVVRLVSQKRYPKVLALIFGYCKDNNLDIVGMVEEKMNYNKTRDHLHGNKF